MDIAAISTRMKTADAQISAGVMLTRKAMDTTEAQAAGLIDLLKTGLPPFGHKLDIRI